MNINQIKNRFFELLCGGGKALLISKPGTMQYFTGAEVPGSASEKTQHCWIILTVSAQYLICPPLLISVFTDQGWTGSVITYTPGSCPVLKLSAVLLHEFGLEPFELLFERDHFPAHTAERLSDFVPGAEFKDVSSELTGFRSVKTDQELALLTMAAKYSDRGIAGVMHHIASGRSRSEKYISEDIRAHTLERGLHIGGYDVISQVASSVNAKYLFPEAPGYHLGRNLTFAKGETVRMEIQGKYYGYRSDIARILIMTEGSDDQMKTYAGIVILRKLACRLLKPGSKACEVFRALAAKADEIGLDAMKELGFGHSIGVTVEEAPFITGSDATVIRENMCLVIAVTARMTSGDIMSVRDLVIIRENGAEIVGWYENWDFPYITAFTF